MVIRHEISKLYAVGVHPFGALVTQIRNERVEAGRRRISVFAATARRRMIAWEDPHAETAARMHRVVEKFAERNVLLTIVERERRAVRKVEYSEPEAKV